jgi:hypothetical protein
LCLEKGGRLYEIAAVVTRCPSTKGVLSHLTPGLAPPFPSPPPAFDSRRAQEFSHLAEHAQVLEAKNTPLRGLVRAFAADAAAANTSPL